MNDNELIFGIRPVIEAIRAGKTIDRLMVKQGLRGSLYHELIGLVRETGIPYAVVPAERLDQVTRKNHQGVIAWISAIEFTDIENFLPQVYEKGEEPFLVMLNGISDVRNFGAIARTAECFGVHAIVIPEKGSARINADAIKTSAGALHRIPVCRVKSPVRTIEFLRNSGLNIFAASEKSFGQAESENLGGPAILILGAEDRGVSPELLALADKTVSIPMAGSIESLNVSVAAGILLYEISRQRRKTSL